MDNSSLYTKDLPPDDASLFKLDKFMLFDVEEAIRLNLNKENLRNILKMLIDNSIVKVDIDSMKIAHEAGDWDTIQKLAHKIKGGAVYIGAIRLKMACQYLERYWKVGERTLLEKLYQQLLQVVDETHVVILDWLTQEA